MELRINKSGSKIVHAGHMTDETPVSECGSGEQYNGLNRSKPWKRLPEDTEVTCKKCLKKMAESETETSEILEDTNTMDAIAEAESEIDQRPAGHDDPLYIAPGRALVDRTEPGKALAMISGAALHSADDPAAWLVREGRRWKLVDDYGDEEITVRAGTIAKAVKAWAKRLGLMLDDIVIEKEF